MDDVNPVASAFVNAAQEAFMFENGPALAKLFVFGDETLAVLSSRLAAVDDFEPYVVVASDAIFGQFTAAYLRYARDRRRAGAEDGHRQLCRVAELFVALLGRSQGPWLLPVLRAVVLALCGSAQATGAQTGDSAVFTQAASLLLRILIDLLGDSCPLESSKRAGAVFVAALLLRMSLRTSAAPGAYASKALEVRSLAGPAFSRRDRTSYSYWLGRYYLVCYYVDLAREQLEYAFGACPAWHYRNKRAILRHLIAANMIRGRLPTQRLLAKYDMEPVYAELARCFRRGNVAGFERALVGSMELFRAQGNFLLLLERTKLLMFRNVLQRMCRIHAGSERGKIVAYRDILTAFQVATQNPAMDTLEMESILASLVSQKLVLGYLFHHQRLLNLSRKMAFPAIARVGVAAPRKA
ncbi:hypothetical protein IWQ57_003167 [Coemansia nantahalensis]|uniref:Uncharacterized protein n=1 Tax=Coemansia nantahalensis TaxID=2789366 RepID=A0ACC1JY09_9FUNG|nr:hypothetical protein IWQ57_003167 [Coemansia nantahalensis]